jgi:18S rRNA (guanine1575-N7)-methyltransferase
MLEVATDEDVDGDLVLLDLGQGLPVRNGIFDGAISVSALQWLCNADKTGHSPRKRLLRLFETLYSSLKRGARAALQFYPESPAQQELITSCALRCGFTGGVVIDFPNSAKAKKYYLVLFAGVSAVALPNASTGEPLEVGSGGAAFVRARAPRARRTAKRKAPKSIDWVIEKKERQRERGVKVPSDSKYSGRRRRNFAI